MNILQRLKAWRERRYWQRWQLEHLRHLISSDWRWLAHDPVARELTDRYMRALREDWYTLPHEGPDTFRRRIGLEPIPMTQEGLSLEETVLLRRALDEFEDANETTVDEESLMRFARLGFLRCTYYEPTEKAQALLDPSRKA